MAEKHGENRSGIGVREDMEQRMDGVVVYSKAKVSSDDNQPIETVATTSADVEKESDTPGHVHIKIPDTSHVLNFEQQIWELDAAINENISGMNLATNQEVFLRRKNNAQTVDAVTLEHNERIHASGLSAATQVQSSKFGPQGIVRKPMQEQKENLGLF